MNYFEAIRIAKRLSATDIVVLHSNFGTDPRSVVNSAEAEFEKKGRRFEAVFAVFDRDDHRTYPDALARAGSIGNTLKNDQKQSVRFSAVASVPCFELWLLLHFQDVFAFYPRHEVLARLKQYLPHYEKGMKTAYVETEPFMASAKSRAAWLRQRFNPHTGTDPYTDIDRVVATLTSTTQ